MMETERRLQDLLAQWRRAREQGQARTAADLCRDCPELLPELEARLRDQTVRGEAGVGQTLSFASSDSEPRTREANNFTGRASLPGYEILEELGRGGMGVVYKARQIRLNRIVALKMVLAGSHAGPVDLLRFLSEAESEAALSHPGIVRVYEFGTCDGLPYFAMEFCPGQSLTRHLDGTPLPPARAVDLVRQLAEAVTFAHERGIVHRDLKPSNILMDEAGRPKITDFGLAKRGEGGDGLTQTGAVMGTPSYMAPEQARGDNQHVGRAADVYALGSVLYELLTGRPPFKATSHVETIRQVLEDEPVAPTRLQSGTPRDLETICLTCLQKEPHRRYATAQALAEDLRRFRDGEPILARPVGRLERMVKWTRRRPALAALVAVSTAAAVALIALIAAYSLRVQKERDQAVLERGKAEMARADADGHRRAADRERDAAVKAKAETDEARAKLETTLVDLYTTSGLMAAERNDPAQAVLWFANAAALSRNDPDRERANRVRLQTWMRQIPVPVLALPHEKQRPRSIVFHPGGRHLMTATVSGCTVWDLEREKPLPLPGGERAVSAAIWNPAGDRLVLAGLRGDVEVYEFPSGKRLLKFRHPGGVAAAAFAPDGRFLVLAGAKLAVHDSRSDEPLRPALDLPGPAVVLSFSPKGDRLGVACADNKARVFAFPPPEGKAEPLFPAVDHKIIGLRLTAETPFPVGFLAGGGWLTVTGDAEVSWWDGETGKLVRTVPFEVPGVNAALYGMSVHPEGTRFVLHGFSGAQSFDAATGQPEGPAIRHRNTVHSVAFSPVPQSNLLLNVSGDRTGQLWTADGKPVGPPVSHHADIKLAAFSPHGHLFATAQFDGLVRVWKLPEPELWQHRVAVEGARTMARLTGDGRHVYPVGAGTWGTTLTRVRLYDVATGEPDGPALEAGGMIMDAAVSPDGATAVTLSSSRGDRTTWRDGRLQLWDRRTGARLHSPLSLPYSMGALAYAPDGKSVVLFLKGGTLLQIDVGTGEVVKRARHPRPFANSIRIGLRMTADGRSFLTWGQDSGAEVWDLAAFRLRYPPLPHETTLGSASSTPDGKLLLTAGYDGMVRLWDHETGAPAGEPLSHPDWLFQLAFSPDQRYLLTSCRDGMARLWDWKKGVLARPPFRHGDEVYDATFTPDGRSVWTVSRDNTARLWDCDSGKPLTPSLELGRWGFSALVTPDGRHALAAGYSSELAVLDLRDLRQVDALAAEDLKALGEMVAVQEIHPGGGVVNLTSAQWLERWQSFRARHPDYARLDPWRFGRDWHWQQARAREREKQWQAALFHLDQLILLDGSHALAYRHRGDVHERLRDLDKAVADWERAVEKGADGGRLWLEAGRRAADPERALDYLTRATRSKTAGWQAWYERGLLHARGQKWDEVRADLGEAAKRGANLGDVWYELARRERDPDRGLWCLDRAVEADPDGFLSVGRRGIARAERGQWDEALADFVRLKELRADDSLPWYGIALSHLAAGNLERYALACEEAVAHFGSKAAPLPALIQEAAVLGPGAVKDFGPLLRAAQLAAIAAPQNCASLHRLGALEFRAGRIEKATRTLAEARRLCTLEQKPNDLLFLGLIEHGRGQTMDAQKLFDEAVKRIEQRYPPGARTAVPMVGWQQRLELPLLRREVEAALKEKKP